MLPGLCHHSWVGSAKFYYRSWLTFHALVSLFGLVGLRGVWSYDPVFGELLAPSWYVPSTAFWPVLICEDVYHPETLGFSLLWSDGASFLGISPSRNHSPPSTADFPASGGRLLVHETLVERFLGLDVGVLALGADSQWKGGVHPFTFTSPSAAAC